MAVDSPVNVEQNEDPGWLDESELPARVRAGSKAEEIRNELRAHEGKFKLVAKDTTNPTSVFRTYSGPDFQVTQRDHNRDGTPKGTQMHTIKRGNREGEQEERKLFDVYVRYLPGYVPAPRASSENGEQTGRSRRSRSQS